MVCGRSPPSRWSCSSTLGALRTWSRVRAIGSVGGRSWPSSCQRFDQRHDGVTTCASSPPWTRSPPRPARSSAPREWLTIEQDRVDQFADATGDHQWIHVDVERAAGPVRRHHRPRLPHAVAGPVPRQPRCSRSRPPAPSSTTASTRCASPTRSGSARGSARTVAVAEVTDLPAGKQLTAQARHRDRGRGQARLRRRDGRPAAALRPRVGVRPGGSADPVDDQRVRGVRRAARRRGRSRPRATPGPGRSGRARR